MRPWPAPGPASRKSVVLRKHVRLGHGGGIPHPPTIRFFFPTALPRTPVPMSGRSVVLRNRGHHYSVLWACAPAVRWPWPWLGRSKSVVLRILASPVASAHTGSGAARISSTTELRPTLVEAWASKNPINCALLVSRAWLSDAESRAARIRSTAETRAPLQRSHACPML